MEWQIILCLIGFIIGYWLYERYQYRSGGVIVVPLVAIYVISFPILGMLILFISFFNFLVLEYLFNKKFVYGRRLMYLSYIISISMALLVGLLKPGTINLEWFPILLCGMISYNFHRELHSKIDTRLSGVVSLSYFSFTLVLGFLLMIFV